MTTWSIAGIFGVAFVRRVVGYNLTRTLRGESADYSQCFKPFTRPASVYTVDLSESSSAVAAAMIELVSPGSEVEQICPVQCKCPLMVSYLCVRSRVHLVLVKFIRFFFPGQTQTDYFSHVTTGLLTRRTRRQKSQCYLFVFRIWRFRIRATKQHTVDLNGSRLSRKPASSW